MKPMERKYKLIIIALICIVCITLVFTGVAYVVNENAANQLRYKDITVIRKICEDSDIVGADNISIHIPKTVCRNVTVGKTYMLTYQHIKPFLFGDFAEYDKIVSAREVV